MQEQLIACLPVFEGLANDQLQHSTSEPLRHVLEFLFIRKRNIYSGLEQVSARFFALIFYLFYLRLGV